MSGNPGRALAILVAASLVLVFWALWAASAAGS
jgi:hypothetical protein